jgi:hypothetical protein
VTAQRPEVTSCNFTAPIATLGALRNPLEVLLHPNCTQIAQNGFHRFPFDLYQNAVSNSICRYLFPEPKTTEMGGGPLFPNADTINLDDEQLPAINRPSAIRQLSGGAAACSSFQRWDPAALLYGQLLLPIESPDDVKCPLQRSMIAEAMERDNQISLKVGAIGFLLGEALGNVQGLLEKGAGLLALAEGTQEIAHFVVGDGEVAQEVYVLYLRDPIRDTR